MSESPAGAGTTLHPGDTTSLLPFEVGGGVAAVVVATFLVRRLARRSREPSSPSLPVTPLAPEGREALQPPTPVVRVPVIVPDKLELEAKVRERAELEAAKRAEVEALARTAADADSKAKAEEERHTLKELEEERKKAEYRLHKAQEAAEKEARRAESEQRAAAEAAAKRAADAQAAADKAAAELADQKKIAAVAGRTLADGLDRTRHGFMARLGQLFGGNQPIDDKILAELEDVLFTADIGVKTAQRLLELARDKVRARELSDGSRLKSALRDEIEKILALDHAGDAIPLRANPTVVMVVGVNGAGKTTTIGKLAAQLKGQGKESVLAAGDTFRAGATEQLEIWAQRAQVPLVRGPDQSDPSAVVFDAVKKAQATHAAAVICDTAGRLHTNAQLMDELKKVKRVLDKALPGAPHEVLLVLDATMGQNAIAQARQFHEALGVTGIALTKLDGTAKGGVIIGICDELKIPVRYVGVGEAIEDLRSFAPRDFVEALFA